MLCSFILNVQASTNKLETDTSSGCICCKNCKEQKCQDLCKKWSHMSAEEQKSTEGKKVKEECMAICKEHKCCSSTNQTSCEGMQGKGCCEKK